eukprot:395132-Ditylum_brightwellii.AAC.1
MSTNNNSEQSSKRPLTTPTSKPPASVVCDELLLMMQKMNNNLKQDINNAGKRQELRANDFAGYISEISSKVISNSESW